MNMLPLQPGDVPDTFADVEDLVRDFDYKPSGSSRLYGWLSNANVKEELIESNGYGFRLAYSKRSSKSFFSNYFINFHDKNFNINDMGYIKKYDNISVGANYDIERIEVLNGPQGTYYGASATSGTVRIITKKPDPNAVVGGVDVSYGGIEGADGISTLEGFVNIPVQDGVSALRLVAWYDKSDGFIDNVSTSRTYMNGATASNSQFAQKAYNEE